MAKQTFTVGQVLTAAQMTSLQQTSMGGGSTTAKTASYTLVAADAGTVVQMNSASATTITVNTALFAAGDTVQIQNVGVGVCTVTAGTATVSTSATLALKQYDSGDLYFNTTSAAFFFSTDAADSTSPLTTKGDLYGFSTLDARIPIGANDTALVADSTQSTGLAYKTKGVFNGLTTTGDTIYSSSGTTQSRLGIGSTGQVLTVASGVPSWATPASGGKVLQVVTANATAVLNSSSTTFVTTGLTATITPTLNTSTILILVTQNGCFKNNGNSNNALNIRLRRTTTTLASSTFVGYTATASENQVGTVAFSYVDSPATTSATTYLTEFSNFSATSFVAVQQNTGDTSSIVLLEIGA